MQASKRTRFTPPPINNCPLPPPLPKSPTAAAAAADQGQDDLGAAVEPVISIGQVAGMDGSKKRTEKKKKNEGQGRAPPSSRDDEERLTKMMEGSGETSSLEDEEDEDGVGDGERDEESSGGYEQRQQQGCGSKGQVEEEDDDAEHLNYLRSFVAEVMEDSRSPDGVEDGLAIVRNTEDPKAAEHFLQWLILPLSTDRFQQQFWEKRPFLIRRPRNRNLYEGWFEKEDIETLLEKESLKYGVNVDVTKYKDGARANFSTEGAARASQVWRKFSKGWSVRILHPQRWSNSVFLLLSAFERYWGCQAGCNAYLTPAKSQGFSPHYDDIEAFVLQTEGRKRWRCYAPRSIEDVLPRFSSNDFSQEEIGDPILDEVLEAGDLLYMPKGTIHQAEALADTHSLHITVSVGQRNTWGDYLELALPRALELAWEDHLILREALPKDFASYMGVIHSEDDDPRRAAFLERVILCMDRLVKSGPWDSAVDQMAVKFLQARLPLPNVSPSERMMAGSGKGGKFQQEVKLASMVRLVAPDVARFVLEDESVALYHMLNNSRALHNECPTSSSIESSSSTESSLIFPLDYAPALEELMLAYPDSVLVSSLPIARKSCALDLVTQLVQAGILTVVH